MSFRIVGDFTITNLKHASRAANKGMGTLGKDLPVGGECLEEVRHTDPKEELATTDGRYAGYHRRGLGRRAQGWSFPGLNSEFCLQNLSNNLDTLAK